MNILMCCDTYILYNKLNKLWHMSVRTVEIEELQQTKLTSRRFLIPC